MEFGLIMDIAFHFAWPEMQYPFIGEQTLLPTFYNVRARGIYEDEWQELASDESNGSDDAFRPHMTRENLEGLIQGTKNSGVVTV
jgi:hypothetical protein